MSMEITESVRAFFGGAIFGVVAGLFLVWFIDLRNPKDL